jgi:prevent-host-death family protein
MSRPVHERRWNLQDAKARLSELVDRAMLGTPQLIMRHGQDAVVVVSVADFEAAKTPTISLLEFFAASPHREVSLDIERDRSNGRAIEL